jgi:hypothetical protein
MKRRSEPRDGGFEEVVGAETTDENRVGEPVAEEVLTSFLFHHLPVLCKV